MFGGKDDAIARFCRGRGPGKTLFLDAFSLGDWIEEGGGVLHKSKSARGTLLEVLREAFSLFFCWHGDHCILNVVERGKRE